MDEQSLLADLDNEDRRDMAEMIGHYRKAKAFVIMCLWIGGTIAGLIAAAAGVVQILEFLRPGK